MYSSFDIVKYFLFISDDDSGELLSNLKLQKLLYYSQGLYLALRGEPLFKEKIFAWVHGPVVGEVYYEYQNHKSNGIPAPDSPPELDSNTREILDEVYQVYGQFSAWKLRELTHNEPPWKNTDNGKMINHQKMKDYFKTQLVDA